MKRLLLLVVLSSLSWATLNAVPSWSVAPSSDPVVRSSSGEVAQILRAEMDRRPGGIVTGNEIHFPSGETFVAVESGTLSLSQCTSGRFCGWAQSNYSGSFYYTSGTGVTRSLSWNARSYSNNRSQAARLYDSTGSSSLCFTPGQDRATVASNYYLPTKVHLLSSTGC